MTFRIRSEFQLKKCKCLHSLELLRVDVSIVSSNPNAATVSENRSNDSVIHPVACLRV